MARIGRVHKAAALSAEFGKLNEPLMCGNTASTVVHSPRRHLGPSAATIAKPSVHAVSFTPHSCGAETRNTHQIE
ncbi:hypothetical protein LMH87_000394 [Akanthomyces muscarius]|uniref:Uncharacterized protein n=1 Tax=Akanthomyces muscarius TaxID=2231603 RepID=A0A9W8UNT3_AKAMU|nr:hypothetical protein LMH87_000394 [Akanthomyces muscarius]KAJ4155135.1 hypothetical protein LMH87_000394 [Akanthomyces muscarius]